MQGLTRRVFIWAVAIVILLLVPLIAMQFNTGVNWGPLDFAVAAVLLAGAAFCYELIAGRGSALSYRIGVGIAVLSSLFLVWANLAVGLIGDEGNPANLMYILVLAVGFAGAIVSGFRPRGLAFTLFAMAVIQVLIGGIAIVMGLGLPSSPPMEIAGVSALFVFLFALAGLMFLKAAGKRE
jgi:hypothetical protein